MRVFKRVVSATRLTYSKQYPTLVELGYWGWSIKLSCGHTTERKSSASDPPMRAICKEC